MSTNLAEQFHRLACRLHWGAFGPKKHEELAQGDGAEPEAVLVTLGPRLEWISASLGRGLDSQILNEGGLRCWYYINIPGEDAVQGPRFHVRLKHAFAPNVYGGGHPTLAAAIAACERHYATGKWE